MRECANNGLVFDEETKKMHIDGANCVGCGRCIGACNFDAIEFENWAATKDLNCRMAEYTKAVVDGRPNFHISLVVDVSPNCDCHAENDIPNNSTNNSQVLVFNIILLIDFRVKVTKITNYLRQRKSMILK